MENTAPEQQQQATVAPQEQQAPAGHEATVRVMEIDYDGDPATIAREEVQARAEGIPIVRKGAARAEQGGKPSESDLIRKMMSGGGEAPATVKANDAVRQFFQQHQLGDPDKMLSEYPSLVKARTELAAKVAQAEKDLSYLGNLSPEAQSVVQMDLDGKDWRKEVASRPSLDYSKKDQDPEALVRAYGNGEITPEDLEEYHDKDGDRAVKAMVQAKLDLYRMKYDADRDKATGYLKEQAELRKENERKYAQSLEAGMTALHAEVPGSEIYGEKIKQLMSPAKLLGMFFKEDGVTLKPDGPKKAWLLSEMDTILQAGMKRMELGAQDAATKDFLRRTPERRTMAGRSQAAPTSPGSDKRGLEAAREAVRRRMMST